MRIAAYQADLGATVGNGSLAEIAHQVRRCEDAGVDILCAPEAVLGGLADDRPDPAAHAIAAGDLDVALAPLASDSVVTIVGFTEIAAGRLYNSAAVLHRGAVIGAYRKLHPAIRRSVYDAGSDTPVFRIGNLTFGIVICNDSNFDEPAARIAAQGATMLFIPTNNALPVARFDPLDMAAQARNVDIGLARAHGLWIVRADVAGRHGESASRGSSAITGPDGATVTAARGFMEDLILADVRTRAGRRR